MTRSGTAKFGRNLGNVFCQRLGVTDSAWRWFQSYLEGRSYQERPRGDLPPGLWADPSSLAGKSAEGKGLGLQPCLLELAPPNHNLSGCCGAPRSSSAQVN
ncbi:hypothetical protein P4O66_000621 [Electrophorus voltai]|uniref:Uncharacterized protein n=1 Tax=Electrophorus voltai TaxID=2609070 RepID=A0AAD9DYY8_9TELE|nr:hypothetical protein P4O66_000621 [Electrophorus voltai]